MGYIHAPIEGALAAVEDDLVAAANAAELPEWIQPTDSYVRKQRAQARRDHRTSTATPPDVPVPGTPDRPEVTAEDELTEQLEHARRRDEGAVVLSLATDVAPSSVRERCQRWLAEHRGNLEYRDGADFVEFRQFQVVFELDADGTVTAAFARASFKDH